MAAPRPDRPPPVPDACVTAAGPSRKATQFGPEVWDELNRQRRAWIAATFPGGVMCLPAPPPGTVPHPTLRRRPRPPHVPKPPPHLDPDLSEAERADAYRKLTGCDPPVWYC